MAPKKKVLAVVKIQLEAGSATPAPPVGTALGPHGVQTMEFCKQYNQATESMRGQVIPVDITIYEDRSFSFVLKTSPTPVLLRTAAGLDKGAATAGREQVGTITDAQLAEIATTKLADLNTSDLECSQEAGGRHGTLHGHQGRRLGQDGRGETMTQHGKKYKESLTKADRESMHGVSRGGRPGQATGQRQVRRDGRARRPPRGRPPQGRPDRPRHAVAPLGDRPHRAGGGLRRR